MQAIASLHMIGNVTMCTILADDQGQQYVIGYVSAYEHGQPFAGCVYVEDEYVPVAGETMRAALDQVELKIKLPVTVIHDHTA